MKGLSYLLVSLFLCIGLIPSAFAQKQNDDEQLKKADKLFEEGKYAEAYPLYTHLLSLRKGNADITFKYGATLLYSSDHKSEAIPYLKKAAAKSTTDVRVFYFLGKAYQLNYEFKKAIIAYNQFKSKADSKSLAAFDVDQVIRQSENGNELLANLNEVLVLDKKDVAESEFFRYYELENLAGKILLAPEEFQTSLDKKKGHRPVIYTAPLSNLVYFSSYGKNGNTGKDIYYASRRGDGTWSDPVKLPAPVNTKYNEDYPFFHSDGKTLFFSSDGHNSMGGYDIFRSVYNPATGSYSEPQNLDFAINTPDDDLFYIADSLNQIAYFASARASKQNRLHVYKVKVDLIPSNMIIIKGDFISEVDPLLKNARITVEDEQTKRKIAVLNTDDKGNYLIDFKAGGQYNFYVEAGANGIIHTGRVEIPRLDYMAAFKQELIMIDDKGTERLMIKNYFDTPLDEDMQELSAEILKRRALLDVTPEEELDQKSISENVPDAETDFDKLYLIAGFTNTSDNEGIAVWASEKADELSKINQEYKDLAGVALRESKNYDKQASEKIIEVQTKIRAYQYNDDPDKKLELLKEAVKLRVSAENDLIGASAALMLADQLSASVQKREILIAGIQQSGNNVNQALADENADVFKTEISKLDEFEKELKLSDRGLADPVTFIESVKDIEFDEKNTLLDYAEKLREEKNSTLAMIKRLETQYQNASKKDKEDIETQLSKAKDDLVDIEKENEAAWKNYRDQDWDASVASESVNLAIEFEGQTGEGLPDQESINRIMDHVETQQKSLMELSEAEDAALVALGFSTEEILASGSGISETTVAASEAEGSLKPQTTKTQKTMEEELVEGYYDDLNAARSNANQIDRLQETILLKQQLLSVVNREIESGDSSFDNANLLTLRSDLTDELEQLNSSFVTALINQESGFNEIVYYIPDYENKLDEINNSNLSDLEKNKAISDYYEEVSLMLNAILDSISLIPVDEDEIIIVLRRRMEDENSLRANIAFVDAERYNLNQELIRQSDVVMSIASDEELINAVYPNYLDKKNEINKKAIPTDEKSMQLIQLNESLIARMDGRIAELNADKSSASEEELSTINANITAFESIKQDKKQEINDSVGSLAVADNVTTAETELDNNKTDAPFVLSPEKKSDMIATLDPMFDLSYTAMMNSGKPEKEKLTKAVEMYSELGIAIDQKISSLKQDGEMLSDNVETAKIAEELKTWEALAVSNADDKAALTAELAGIPIATNESIAESESPVEKSTADEPETAIEVDTWNALLLSDKTDAALDLWVSEEKISTDPGYANEINKSKADDQLQDIGELNILKNQKASNAVLLASADKKEAKKIEKEQAVLNDDIIIKEIRLLDERIPLVIAETNDRLTNASEIIDRSAAEAYLQKANSLYAQSATKDGEEKLNVLKQAYQLSLMSLQKAGSTSLSLEIAQQAGISGFYNSADDAELSYEERKQFYSDNIKALTSLEAENRNAMNNMEADGVSKNDANWIEHDAVSKIYRDAIVWNNNKLAKLNSLHEEIRNNVIAESGNLKAPVNGVEFSDAMHEIGMNEAQIEYIGKNPEIQTYYAMSWKEQIVSAKIDALKDQKENYIAQASNAEKNSKTENGTGIDQLTNQEAIDEYNKSKKYNTEAIVWYEKADSINLIINALENHKNNLVANREAFLQRMDEENKLAVADIASGKPLAGEVDVASAEVEEPIIEDNTLKLIDDPDTGFMFEMGKSFYTQRDPIPVDPPLPSGIIFKVQIGAFRNVIPPETFTGLTPLTAEKLNNGITRYSVGIFHDFETAKNARWQVRSLGYSDAFIVAFQNGKRIPVYQALSILGLDPQTAIESVAANTQTSTTETAGNTTGSTEGIAQNNEQNNEQNNASGSNTNTVNPVDVDGNAKTETRIGYYKAPNAAPATEVESTEKLFYTVQVGVYSKPVSLADIYNIQPLNVERTGLGYTRYTSGQYTDILDAETHKTYVINQGILDAFITAYYQGKRISIAKAQTIMITQPQAVEEDAISPFNFEEPVDELEIDTTAHMTVTISRESPLARDEIIRNAEPRDLRYVIYLGSYRDDIPNIVASALLEYSEAGIKKAINQGNTIYSTRELRSMYEAEEWLGRFREAGVDKARIIYVVSGEEITLEQAKVILEK